MKRLLLSLIAAAAVLVPLSQNAQAAYCYYYHWNYYHGYYHYYWHYHYWR